VHPAFGGSWWSQLHPSDLRSYDGDPMTWDGFTDKLTEIGSGDWIFEIRLYIKDGLTGQVFNNQSQTPLKLLDDLVSSGEASFYIRNYVTLSEWTGWHVIRLEVTGGTASLYLDNEFKASKTTGLSIPFPQDSVTAADIGIDYAVLLKPDADVPVWYAEYKDTHANYADRDFSISYQWSAVQTALRGLPWENDYHFRFDFTVPEDFADGSYWLMLQSNGRVVATLDKDTRGSRFSLGTFSFTNGLTVYTPFQPSLAGRHEVTLAVVGTTLKITVDGTEYEQTGERVASSEYDRVITTQAPVTFHAIELVDDTAGTELWHATHADLYVKYPALPYPAGIQRALPFRNFAADPMTFTDSYTAQDGIGTDDFTLSVDFTLLRENASGYINIGCLRCSYYATTKAYQPSVQILKTDGTKDALYPVGTMHITGDIVGIKVIKVGQNVRMVVYARDGSTVKDQTKPLPDGATVTYTSGATTYPGNIFAASIRNDTTGETVWQAAYSDLYDTSNPWPSPVPENFAEKAKAFYDCQAVVQEALDPTHDYKFLLDFEITKESGEASVFYAGAANFPFGVYCYSDNTIRVFSNLLRAASNPTAEHTGSIAYSGDTRLQGRHIIELNIEGDAMRTFLNGSEVAYTSNTVRTGTTTVGLPNCNSGYVYKIQIMDLTIGCTVWSYPSEAERVRLITKTNVRTDRGAFEAADASKVSGITTALDLRGTPVAHTFIASGYFPLPNNDGLLHYFPLLTQGAALDGTGDRVTAGLFVSVDYRNQQTSCNIKVVWADSSYALHSVTASVDSEFFNKRHLIAATMRTDRKTSKWTTELYVDGVLLTSDTGDVTRFVFGSAGSTTLGVDCIQIQGRIYTGFLSESNKIDYALVIGRVLSAAEIKVLTPGTQS
jgi:hypothetical protein